MKRAIALSIGALAGLGMAGFAQAAEPTGYVGASVGQSQIKQDFSSAGLSASIDEKQTGYKIFAGARIGLFGLEGGYVNFGNPKPTVNRNTIDVNASGFDAFATLNLGLGGANLFAKAGAINWKADETLNGIAANQSGTDPAYGIGASLQLANHVSARAEYETFNVKQISDLNFWSAGLQLDF